MAQYIDKDALVAEIERRKELVDDPILSGNDLMIGERNAYFNLLSFINTLEVMEADAEIVEVEDNNNSMYAYTHLEICTDEDLSKICKAGDKAKVIIIKQK